MKRHFLILTILLLSLTSGHGQTNVYHPFPDSNAYWGDKGWNIFSWAICNNTRYGINGDTIINGKNYKKIYSLYDTTLTNPNSTYYAAIRESNKRIYALIGSIPEQVLYDFNLSVGDTIEYYYSLLFMVADTFSRVVTAIDSLQLYNGEYRKRYFLSGAINCGVANTVIEGIGCINWIGLFNPLINDMCTCGDMYQFTCAKQNDTVLYVDNPDCGECFCALLTDVKKTEEQEKLLIYPNPFSREATLFIDNSFKDATLTVCNLYGQQVKQIKNISGESIILHRENLPGGLYFLRLTRGNETISTGKFIVLGD